MNQLAPLIIMAATAENGNGVEAPQRGRVYAADGHELHVKEWINFQEEHMVRFLHDVLSPDPEMCERPTSDEDVHEALRLSWRMMEEPPESLLDSPELKWLGSVPEAGKIMGDWLERFGPIFNHTCKQQGFTSESGSEAVSAYQSDLIGHVRELRRVIHFHTGMFPAVSELLTHIHSRLFEMAGDTQLGEYLDYRTIYPQVRVGSNGQGEELAALAEGLLTGDADVTAAPDDAYARTVYGESRTNRQKLVELLLRNPEKVVVLDARPNYRVEKPLKVFRRGVDPVVGWAGEETDAFSGAGPRQRVLSA